jgi:hypothetical protein
MLFCSNEQELVRIKYCVLSYWTWIVFTARGVFVVVVVIVLVGCYRQSQHGRDGVIKRSIKGQTRRRDVD